MATQIVIWWLVLQIFGLIGLPFAAFLFQALPDQGYAFSKSLGLLLTGYGAWLLAMLGLGSFGGPLVVIIMGLLGAGGLLLLRRYWHMPLHPASLTNLVKAHTRAHWPGILAYEALFAVALVGLAWMRSHDLGFVGPNPWGTERPMDFAFLNAIRYSTTFPPADPWLAGFSINYYYFGYLLMAILSLLSGLEPGVAYNLSLAAIFALTALGVAGIVSNLIGLGATKSGQTTNDERPVAQDQRRATADRRPPTANSSSDLRRSAVFRALFSVLGVVLVLLAGNQFGGLQVLVGNYRIVALDGQQLVDTVVQSLDSRTQPISLPYPAYTPDGDLGTITTLERGDRVNDFNWWWPSRALWDEEGGMRRYNITEFPFFSFWLGDMHPHVMALPFNLLAMALSLAMLARPALPQFTASRYGWLELVLTALVLGSLYTINSWDLPTYILLYLGALTLLAVHLTGSLHMVDWRELGKQGGLVILALVVLFLPFYLTFKSLVGFAAPLVDIPLLSRITQVIAPFVAQRSGLHAFLIIFGLFILPLTAFTYLYAARRAEMGHAEVEGGKDTRRQERRDEQATHQETGGAEGLPDAPPDGEVEAGPAPVPSLTALPRIRLSQSGSQGALLIEKGQISTAVHRPSRDWLYGWTQYAMPLLPLMLLVIGLLTSFPLLSLAGLGLFALHQAAIPTATSAARFACLVVALGCAICFGTELIYIRDVFSSRMNTIFKFYYQVWLLWGTTAAFGIWWLLSYATCSLPGMPTRANILQRTVAYTVVGLCVLLLLGGLVYPAINLRDLVEDGRWVGLEGHTPRENVPAELDATRWIRENVPPESVVLEMVSPGGGSYNGEGYGGVSASTGRPTVLGWVGHQQQWRGGDQVARAELDPRQMDVDTIYKTTDPQQALELLRKYSVKYVYVGELERRAYPQESLSKFDQIAQSVFQMDQVTIYKLPEQ